MFKKIAKIFYILGFLFWTGMLLSAVLKLIGYNEFFHLFDFAKVQITTYDIREDSLDNSLVILYTYSVDNKIFNRKLDVDQSYFDENFSMMPDSTIEINYNLKFPNLSYITNLPLEQRKQKVGIIISCLFIAFLSVLYFFGNIDEWAERYKKA